MAREGNFGRCDRNSGTGRPHCTRDRRSVGSGPPCEGKESRSATDQCSASWMRVLMVSGRPDDQKIHAMTEGDGIEPFTAQQLAAKVREVLGDRCGSKREVPDKIVGRCCEIPMSERSNGPRPGAEPDVRDPAEPRLTQNSKNFYCWGMEVKFTPEQEAQLFQIATHNGKRAEQLVEDAALRILENDARFPAGVQRGLKLPTAAPLSRKKNGRAHRADASVLMKIRWTTSSRRRFRKC